MNKFGSNYINTKSTSLEAQERKVGVKDGRDCRKDVGEDVKIRWHCGCGYRAAG